jgi:hypothetical protein
MIPATIPHTVLAFDSGKASVTIAVALLGAFLGSTLRGREWLRAKRVEVYDSYLIAIHALATVHQQLRFAPDAEQESLERERVVATRDFDSAHNRATLVASRLVRARLREVQHAFRLELKCLGAPVSESANCSSAATARLLAEALLVDAARYEMTGPIGRRRESAARWRARRRSQRKGDASAPSDDG